MKYVSAFFKLIVWSSENPEKVSRSLKAGAVFGVSLLALFKVNVSGLPETVDALVQLSLGLAPVLSGFATLWYVIRKIKLTVNGQNRVFSDPVA